MNKHASELGKLGKGIPKKISEEERRMRAGRMEFARKMRWPEKSGETYLDTIQNTKPAHSGG